MRVPRGGWGAVVKAVPKDGVAGLWRAEIGAPANEGVLLALGTAAIPSLPAEVLDTVELEATARPTEPGVLDAEPGCYAHRWFEVADGDWAEFENLSTFAWPEFEGGSPGVEILGLFRAVARTDVARVLLITRYPGLAEWERSRTNPGGAGSRPFQRRQEITRWTIVRTYRPVPRNQGSS